MRSRNFWLGVAVGFWLGAVMGTLTMAVRAEDLSNVVWLDCHDGDTCAFNILMPAVLGEHLGVRLTGIDAPEINGKCEKEKRLAVQARDFLKSQLTGKSVVFQQVFRDKYFRLEAVVVADGVNLNQLMVQQGYAVPYPGIGPRKNWC